MLESVRSGRAARRVVLLFLLLLAGTLLLALNLPLRAEALADRSEEAAASAYHSLRNLVLGPPKVALQIGHLDAASHPRELANLRTSTGGYGGGVFEVDVNRSVAHALEARLEARGIAAELLPATVPGGYRADAMIAIHADSSGDRERRGYKSAVFRDRRNRWDAELKRRLDTTYLLRSDLPSDDANVSGDMLEYYAFNRRYRHSLARATPAVIVEMGYLSNAEDLKLLKDPDRVAALLEEGIVAFLSHRGRLPSR